MAEVETLEPIKHNGKVYTHVPTGHKGKKAGQVGKILEQLQEQPGVPLEFGELCANADAKYPQDVQAAVMALEMCELVSLYTQSGEPKKLFYVWTTEVSV